MLLRMLLVAALVGSGSMQDREKCMINFIDGCRAHPSYGGLADDSAAAYNHMGVGKSEERCLARSKEYFEWCANDLHQQIMATYIPTGEVSASRACAMLAQGGRRCAEALSMASRRASSRQMTSLNKPLNVFQLRRRQPLCRHLRCPRRRMGRAQVIRRQCEERTKDLHPRRGLHKPVKVARAPQLRGQKRATRKGRQTC